MVSTLASQAESMSSPLTGGNDFFTVFCNELHFFSDLVSSEAHISAIMTAIAMKIGKKIDIGLLSKAVILICVSTLPFLRIYGREWEVYTKNGAARVKQHHFLSLILHILKG